MSKYYAFCREPSYGAWEKYSFVTLEELETFIIQEDFEEIIVIKGEELDFDLKVNWK